MPLHDWSKIPEWEGVHLFWITELFRDISAKLPPGYRAGVATIPSLTVGAPATHPDVSVRREPGTPHEPGVEPVQDEHSEWDTEVTLLSVEPTKMIRVYRDKALIAVVELISPGNKDRDANRDSTIDRFVGYLALGVHVLFVDVHAQPLGTSLADMIATVLEYSQPPCPAPHAIAYRVGLAADGIHTSLLVRRAPLTISRPLPAVPLPLSQSQQVLVDLETTYTKAVNDYLPWLRSDNGASA